MKGTSAATVAFASLAQGAQPAGDLLLALTADEEVATGSSLVARAGAPETMRAPTSG